MESQIKSSFTQMQTNENSTISNFEIVDLNDKKLIEVLELKNQELKNEVERLKKMFGKDTDNVNCSDESIKNISEKMKNN